MLAVLAKHAGTCAAFVAGHDHSGGYGRDPSTGIHHLTLRGVVETVPGDDAFATLTPFADGLFIRGYGREESRWMPFA